MLCVYLNERTWRCNCTVNRDSDRDKDETNLPPRVCTLKNDECAFRPAGPFGPYDRPVR